MVIARRTRTLRLVVAAAAVTVSSIAGEVAWRAVVNAHYRASCLAFDQPLFALTDDGALYGLRPGAEVPHAIGDPSGGPPTQVTYHVGADGLRAHPRWPPPDGPPRILFVGDSYTFGTGVADGVAFPHRCEQLLAARGREVFCINAGVPGHNSEQTSARLRWLLPRHQPRLVVLGFTANDAEPPVFAPIPPAIVRGNAWSWLLADGRLAVNALGSLLVTDTPLLPKAARDYDVNPLPAWFATSPKGAASLRAITAMHELCTAHGVAFSVVTLPAPWLRIDDDHPHAGIHAQVLAHARAIGALAFDALPGLRGAEPAVIAVPGDGHPNTEGHRLLAVTITAHLAAVLP